MSSAREKLFAYLQLFRAPNVFTAIADVAMAYFVTALSIRNPAEFLAIIGATAFLYTAGMVLNDVFDYDVDFVERPERPLPSGRISRSWAKQLGFAMLVLGIAFALLAGGISAAPTNHLVRTGSLSVVLAICIVLYDAAAKRIFLGPVVMGACRFLNILMGMSLYASPVAEPSQWFGFGTSHLMIAGGIGLYIVGVTVFARSEATVSQRGGLILGAGIMAAGIALLAFFPALHPDSYQYRIEPKVYWPLGMLVVSLWIFRRCIVAISDPQPGKVQIAIKFSLMSLIVLDGTLCLLVCPLPYALGIIALLIPMLLLGRWIYST